MNATSIDSRAFRQTVGQFVTGVTVIAVETSRARPRDDRELVHLGLARSPAGAVLRRQDRAPRAAHARRRGFSVNILQHDQQQLSTYFAGKMDGDCTTGLHLQPWEGGPLLDGCVAALGCAVEAIHEGGDHWIVIGRVLSLYRNESATPRWCSAGRYAALATPEPSAGPRARAPFVGTSVVRLQADHHGPANAGHHVRNRKRSTSRAGAPGSSAFNGQN